MKHVIKFVVMCYQRIVSPHFGMRCRFYPTCSSYLVESVESKGVARGIFSGLARLLKCHPFHPGGFDPVR